MLPDKWVITRTWTEWKREIQFLRIFFTKHTCVDIGHIGWVSWAHAARAGPSASAEPAPVTRCGIYWFCECGGALVPIRGFVGSVKYPYARIHSRKSMMCCWVKRQAPNFKIDSLLNHIWNIFKTDLTLGQKASFNKSWKDEDHMGYFLWPQSNKVRKQKL